jgi:hypothetical protein
MGAAPVATKVRFGFRRSYWILLVALPLLVYWMWICLAHHGGDAFLPRSRDGLVAMARLVPPPTAAAVAIYLGWFLVQALLQAILPGRTVDGTVLRDGTRLPYRMNGWLSFWVTLGGLFLAVWLGWLPATLLYDHFGPLLTVANVFTYLLAFYLYFHGKARGTASEVVTGNPVYDYFMGTSLNPRIGGFDIKLFCEARPGLILWVVIDLSCAAKQHELHGAVTTPMMLVCAFHLIYIADYFFHEEAILSTWDIKHENFGWMLCWGDLVWVPFTYTIQAIYLVNHAHDLPLWGTLGILALNFAGYYLFRAANIQKHLFGKDPSTPIWGRKPEFIRTGRGTRLLVSGWWGVARHANYLGDLTMALAWCLPCLFGNLIPYFYIIYFTWLLVHRERRDDAMCHAKYGRDWEEYRRRVRWRILPGVY